MSQVHVTALSGPRLHDELIPSPEENAARGFANALLLALPLWALIGLMVWAIA